VCDVCGSPAEQTVSFSVGARKLAKDLCGTHLQELVRAHMLPDEEAIGIRVRR
jgi:hypothetical protein